MKVFPTGVGVFPYYNILQIRRICLPHRRGGVSLHLSNQTNVPGSSPQAWGCFPSRGGRMVFGRVFPTGVGVFPCRICHLSGQWGLPHRRGGVSIKKRASAVTEGSSPQAWGCFRSIIAWATKKAVFPTGVGVFLSAQDIPAIMQSLPHRRGGVSVSVLIPQDPGQSSPQAWGCFYDYPTGFNLQQVFPTGVGVFLM